MGSGRALRFINAVNAAGVTAACTLGSERTPGANPNGSDTTSAMDPIAPDKDFLKEAAPGSAVEVALGRIAQERGSSDAVKEFGKRMVDDHSKAEEESGK